MADSSCFQFVIDGPPKRVRQIHKKVKTGCQTCKIRRKKCDEAKPFCNRCTSTGRKCDGYRTIVTEPSKEPPFEIRERTLDLPRLPESDLFETEQDYYCFDFFRQRTGPEFAAYYDSSIWRAFTVRACLLFPTVLKAAAAVGAVHRRFELGISAEALRFCGIAMNQYRKALRSRDQDLQTGHPLDPEINMLVSILLCMFEVFQGNYKSAIAHYKPGLTQLLRRNGKRTHSESQRRSVTVDYEALHKFTDRLEARAPQLFGSSTTILSRPSGHYQLDPIPEVFTSLEHARDVIITEGHYIWDAWRQLKLGNLKGFSTQHLHVARLLEWSKAYAEYSKSELGRARPAGRQPYLLKAYREAMYLVILTQLAFHEPDGQDIIPICYLPEACIFHTVCRTVSERRSALNAHLARVMLVTESLFHDDSSFAYDNYSIILDTGLGPPLLLGTESCTSTKVRYQATSLLPEGELRQRIWDAMGVYSIAEKLGSIEEQVVAAVMANPTEAEPKWTDVVCFLEEKKMLVRQCRDDEFGGLVWTQECITY